MAISSPIPTSNKVPGGYLKVTFGVGSRSPGGGAMEILLVGNRLSTASLAVETPTPVFSPEEVADLCGAGSELHRMALACFGAYPNATVTIVAVTESAGAQAEDDTIAFTGSTASAAGAVTVWVGSERLTIAVAVGDAIADVATAVAAAINEGTDLPVTASSALGVVTVEAKQAGPRGNFIRLRSLMEGVTGISHTPVATYLSGGTTSDDPTNALDAVDASRYHLIASPYADTTNLGIVRAHVNAAAEPEVGIRQHFTAGLLESLASSITISDAVNSPRGFLFWHFNSLQTPGELAAAGAGKMARELTSSRAKNMDGEVIVGISPQVSAADRPTSAELVAALNSGLTPLGTDGIDVSFVRLITSYHLDSAGNPDFSVLDASKSLVPDFIADDLQANYLSRFKGFLLDDDPEGTELPDPGVATPSSIDDFIFERLKVYARGGSGPLLLSNVEERKGEIATERDAAADGRTNSIIPIDVVEGFHQFAGDVRQQG